MPLGLSRASQYAVRALVHLARLPPHAAATVHAISDAEGIPEPFLAKVVRRLVSEGYVASFRGPGGGMRLARDPESISVMDVMSCVDGADPFSGCFLGMPKCNEDAPCAMHHSWAPMREKLQSDLARTSIASLASLGEMRAMSG